MPSSWRGRWSRAAPRAISLLWSAYTGSRALAYVDTSPPQLEAVAAILPLWIPWAAATVLLVLGALVPPQLPPVHSTVARIMRQYGMTASMALLMVWGAAFLISDFSRGWVTAGSYVMLGVFAAWSGTVASRELADVRAVLDEEVENHPRLDR